MKNAKLILAILSCVFVSGFAWYHCLMYRPLCEEDFVTITGTLKSYEERESLGDNPYLDLLVTSVARLPR